MAGGNYSEIAGGSITETVDGDYNIYAGRHIINTAGKSVLESGANKGVKFGAPANPPPKQINAKCVVYFRPHSAYVGEYGFDWIRRGDTGAKGDTWFKTIIGRYRNSAKQIEQIYDSGTAADLHPPIALATDLLEYNKLMQTFQPLLILFKQTAQNKDFMYDVPVLTLLKGNKATLTLMTEVAEEPQQLKFKCNGKDISQEKDIKLSKPTITPKSKGKHSLTNYLVIDCINDFSQNKEISAISVNADKTEHEVGKLVILANDRAHRYKANIVFVEVITKNISTTRSRKATPIGREAELKKYLNQAYIQPHITTVTLNLTADTVFNQQYSSNGKLTPHGINNVIPAMKIQDYLAQKFAKQHPNTANVNYTDSYKIFFVNEPNISLYGESKGIGSPAQKVREVLVLPLGFADSTVAHELMHAMGLLHTFDNNNKFTFEQYKTNNIMDYSDEPPYNIPVISTFRFQWPILQSNNQKE